MQTDLIDFTGLTLLAGLLLTAVVVFLKIQAYLTDPRRHERNEAWFAQFEKHQSERYRDQAIRWRVEGLAKHFHRDH